MPRAVLLYAYLGLPAEAIQERRQIKSDETVRHSVPDVQAVRHWGKLSRSTT